MSKMYEDLFRKALNIEEPWVLESVDFDPDAKRIDLYLDFAPGTKFDCPVCNLMRLRVRKVINMLRSWWISLHPR